MKASVLIRVILLVLIMVVVESCYQEIDLSRFRKSQTLVLNSVVSPDTVVMVNLSKTVFFTEHRDGVEVVDDADVVLYVDGRQMGQMPYDGESKMYRSGYRPATGECVEIRVESANGSLVGNCVVPKSVKIEDVGLSCRIYEDPSSSIWVDGSKQNLRRYELTYRIRFQDEPNLRNYYCIRKEDAQSNQSLSGTDYSFDEVFQSQRKVGDSTKPDDKIFGREGRTFTDELFDGIQYEMTIVETGALYDYPDVNIRDRRIILYSLSPEYYNYLTGILNENEESLSGNLIKLGFAEPHPHYSNIVGGTGIVGGVQSSVVEVNVSEVIKSYY